MTKFAVYTRVRALRQEAGDIKEELLKKDDPEWSAWERVESYLLNAETALEGVDLK